MNDSYVGFGAVVTADVWVLLTEASVEIHLPEVCEQLNSPALHQVLTEVHHAVQVVHMSRLGLSVPFFVHWDLKKNEQYEST